MDGRQVVLITLSHEEIFYNNANISQHLIIYMCVSYNHLTVKSVQGHIALIRFIYANKLAFSSLLLSSANIVIVVVDTTGRYSFTLSEVYRSSYFYMKDTLINQ